MSKSRQIEKGRLSKASAGLAEDHVIGCHGQHGRDKRGSGTAKWRKGHQGDRPKEDRPHGIEQRQP